MRRVSESCVKLIQHFEGYRYEAYDDATGDPVPVGGKAKGVLTIGIGHTGSDVHPGDVWTDQKILQTFEDDLLPTEKGVDRLVHVEVAQHQFDGLVSLAFNIGLDEDADTLAEGLGDSTLLKLVNAGEFLQAADQFPKWCHDNGKIVQGLVRRRACERAMFLGKDWHTAL